MHGKPIGHIFLAIQSFLALLAILDTLINECKWVPFSSPTTVKWRQLLFMLMALMSSSIAFLAMSDREFHPAVFRYLLDSGASVAVAFFGLKSLYDRVMFENRTLAA